MKQSSYNIVELQITPAKKAFIRNCLTLTPMLPDDIIITLAFQGIKSLSTTSNNSVTKIIEALMYDKVKYLE